MTQAGFARGPDGVWVSPTLGRMETEIKSNAGVNFEAEMSILANGWANAGFKVAEIAIPTAQAQDPELSMEGRKAQRPRVRCAVAIIEYQGGQQWTYN